MVFVYPILLLKFFSSNRVFQKRVYLLVPTLQFLYAKILFMSYYMNCQIQRFLKFLYTAVHAILLFMSQQSLHELPSTEIVKSRTLVISRRICKYILQYSLYHCAILLQLPPFPVQIDIFNIYKRTGMYVYSKMYKRVLGSPGDNLPKLLKEGGFLRGNRICMKNVLLLRTQKIKAFRQKLKCKQ